MGMGLGAFDCAGAAALTPLVLVVADLGECGGEGNGQQAGGGGARGGDPAAYCA